jgi:hypothetical protein
MRFGIFWRPLRFDLVRVGPIIKAAVLLHNFLKMREKQSSARTDFIYFSSFSVDNIAEEILTEGHGATVRKIALR